MHNLPGMYPCSTGVEVIAIDLLRELPALSCPLLWQEEWDTDPLARLLTDWAGMVGVMRKIINERIAPLLNKGVKVVAVFHGFGLNLLLHSAVTHEFRLDLPVIDQVYEVHGGLVETFFKHFSPPEYIITRANPEDVASRMANEKPILASVPFIRRVQFVKFEENAIDAYFNRIPKQKPVHFIRASFAETEMCREALSVTEKRINAFMGITGEVRVA
jgi:hypothetical protein